MSEERFDRIEEWQRKADERFDRIDHWQANADERFDRIDEWQRKADERFARIDERFDRVDQRIGVLHEDVLARIAATGELRLPTKGEMDQGFADLREFIERRLDPLEATVRQHTIEINELKKRRR